MIRHEVKTVTIAASARVSSEIELNLGQQIVAIELDGALTNTSFSLEGSTHDSSGVRVWNRLNDVGTTDDYVVTADGAGIFPLKLEVSLAIFERVRLYGVTGNEAADRTIRVYIRTLS